MILNKTIPKAKGEIIILSDADTLFNKNTAEKLVQYFYNKDIGVVCGKLILEGNKNEITYWNYENFIRKWEHRINGLFGANGAVYAIRKKYFSEIPDQTIIDDIMVPLKIISQGYNIIYSCESEAHEHSQKDSKKEFHRRKRIGFGNLQLLKFIFQGQAKLKGIKIFTFISHKVIRWLAPFLLSGIFILNIFLLKEPLFIIFFILQLLAYLNALVSQNIFSYFLRMNFALIAGYLKFIAGDDKNIWQ